MALNHGRPDIEFNQGEDIPSAFRRVVADRPDHTALVFKQDRVSWGELGARVNRAANAFLSIGVGKGERVAILSRNSIKYVEAFFGALSAGACVVPLPSMASPEALKLMMEDARPKALLVSEEYKEALAPFINGFDFLSDRARAGLDFCGEGWTDFEQWAAREPDRTPEVVINRDDEFNIIYSSGTTGAPKGIVHTHAVRNASLEGMQGVYEKPGMVNIISTPFYSNTTMVSWLPSMRWGTACVIMEKFNVIEFLELVEKEKVNYAMLVPVQYDRILREPRFDEFDLSSMQIKFCTSAPLRVDLKKEIVDRWPGILIEIFGLTEGGVSTTLVSALHPDKLESVGKPVPGCELKIIDENGQELPTGQTGEIVGRRSYMMTGYLNRDKETEEMLWRDAEQKLYFRTGDMGYLDGDGFLYVSGRKKEVIISGGLNIFAVDLETELLKHEAVTDAAVIAAPSDEWGETPLAFVTVCEDCAETPESLLEWVNARLGKSQRISKVEFLESFPRSEIGKILKKELRKPYWEGR